MYHKNQPKGHSTEMNKLKIHIVEDEMIIAYDLQDMLEELGYTVNDISLSVDEVNNKLKTDDSDLFIVDINLKGKKTGFELEKILLDIEKPVIYMSSTTDRKAIERARTQVFMEKPFNLDDISLAMEQVTQKLKKLGNA